MECRQVRQLADAFISEQLLVETTHAVVAHLDRCAACRAEVDGMRRLRAAARSAFERAPMLAMRPEFASALASRLRAESTGRRTARLPRLLIAMAASLVLIGGGGWGLREWSTSGMLALLHDAVGDHRFCALTFKLTERPVALDVAARRYDAFYGRLVSVEPSTGTLSGGPVRILERHSCVFNGRRFAHIVLRYKGEAVSLMVADDPRALSPLRNVLAGLTHEPSPMPATDGFHVTAFRSTRHAVFVASTLSDEDLQEVARAMAGPVSQALAGA